jgi:ABC-type multidrug transport system ATPase subunit
MTDAILRATGTAKRYGAQEVIRGLDLDLARGQVTVVLGENGAGKTTLMRMLCGDLLADAGTIAIDGHDLRHTPEAARARLIHVAQHPPLAPLLSLREHAQALIAFRTLDETRAQADLQHFAAALHLGHALDRPVRALSGGMAHKAALVLAFVARVPLVMLDEPHAGLDVRSALALRELIVQARASGTAFLLASHLAEATLALADRAIVLRAGGIALDLDAAGLRRFGGDARAFEQAVLTAMGEAIRE